LDFVFRDKQRADLAAAMLWALGPAATNSIPELCRVMDDTAKADGAVRAVGALSGLGKAGFPPLLRALSDLSHSNRVHIVSELGEMGTNALPVVPTLITCLQEADARVARAATVALGRLQLQPEVVVPALAGGLTNSNYEIQASSAEA